MNVKIKVKVNGVDYAHEVEPRMLLAHFLRDTLRLTCSAVNDPGRLRRRAGWR